MEGFKQCCMMDCRKILPISEFYRDASRGDGLDNRCISCRKKTAKKHREKYRDYYVKQSLDYYHTHVEELAEYHKQYYIEHLDYYKAYRKKYYQEHKQELNAKRRAWRRKKRLTSDENRGIIRVEQPE